MPIHSSAGKENDGAVPYGHFTTALKFLRYYLSASSGKGHGIHSPLVFDLVQTVLRRPRQAALFHRIEEVRKNLLKDQRIIEVDDFGAGSVSLQGKKRTVASIASSSLKHSRYSRMMYYLVSRYRPATIMELGTSLGITTAYMAAADPGARLISIEGSSSIAAEASRIFDLLELHNVQLVCGSFEEKLGASLAALGRVDLAFIDGDHRRLPTLEYFQKILPYVHEGSILVFDDIHWSPQMESAWEAIRNHPSVRLTVDVFFMGIVFFSSDIKVKQHFTLRY